MEFLQAVLQSCVVGLIRDFISLLTRRVVLNNLIRNWVVVLGQDLRVPLDGNETLLDQVLLEDRRICWEDDAAIALLHPVAE